MLLFTSDHHGEELLVRGKLDNKQKLRTMTLRVVDLIDQSSKATLHF